jgi:hypothetical protein
MDDTPCTHDRLADIATTVGDRTNEHRTLLIARKSI